MLQELFLDKYTAKNVQNLAQTGKKKYSLLVEQYVQNIKIFAQIVCPWYEA